MKMEEMRKIRLIVVHCSATKATWDIGAAVITKMHRDRGFRECGYHYVVRLDGTIECGRNEFEMGAHVKGHNADSIGICYVGGLDENGKPCDTRTVSQKTALVKKIKDLKLRYPGTKVVGHRDLSPDKDGDGVVEPEEWLKQCPCFNAKTEYDKL